MPTKDLEQDVRRFLESALASHPQYVRAYLEVIQNRLARCEAGDLQIASFKRMIANLEDALHVNQRG